MTVLDYINYLLPTALTVANDKGFKPCMVFACLSQGALETGWCGSDIMVQNNAPFGVKWTGNGKYYTSNTYEYINGVKTLKKAEKFMSYDTLYDGVLDYFNLISSGRYKDTLNCVYVQDVIKVLKQNGYATDITYIDKVMGCYDTIVRVLR